MRGLEIGQLMVDVTEKCLVTQADHDDAISF